MDIYKINKLDKISPHGGGSDNWHVLELDTNKPKFIKEKLKEILNEIEKYKEFDSLPIAFKFKKLLSKSDRFKNFLKEGCDLNQIDSSYYYDENNSIKNELKIIYNVERTTIQKTIETLNKLINFIKENINVFDEIGVILKKNCSSKEKDDAIKKIIDINNKKKKLHTKLKHYLFDINYIDTIELWKFDETTITENSFVQFNKIDKLENIRKKLLHKNISIDENQIISKDDYTFNIDSILIKKINRSYPFLICLASNNKISFDETVTFEPNGSRIDEESLSHYLSNAREKNLINKYKIGVIDSHININDYPSLKEIIKVDESYFDVGEIRYDHGTMVSSIVAINDFMNREKPFVDNLGVFKVEHFSIIPGGNDGILVSNFLNKVRECIKSHKEIKIWNLSIDTISISDDKNNRISYLGKFFEKIQSDYEVLLIISVGNKNKITYGADSLLAVSVGSVFLDKNGSIKKNLYSGEMQLLGRYRKPEVYEFGNDKENSDNYLLMMDDSGILCNEEGTSFAAPRISRKCAFLLDKFEGDVLAVKAYLNLVAELELKSENIPIPTLNWLDKNENEFCLLIYSGKLTPGEKYQIPIEIPYLEEKNKGLLSNVRDVTMAASLTTAHSNFDNYGDEYSSTEIAVQIYNRFEKENGKKNATRLITEKSEKSEQNQRDLIRYFKKYNPNKVLIESNFLNKNPRKKLIKVSDGEKNFWLEIMSTDLFSGKKEARYSFMILIKGLSEDSISNFIINNEKILTKINVQRKIELRA